MNREQKNKNYDYPLRISSIKSSKSLKTNTDNNEPIVYPPMKYISSEDVSNDSKQNFNAEKNKFSIKSFPNEESPAKLQPSPNTKEVPFASKLASPIKYIGGDHNTQVESVNYSIISNDNEKSMNFYMDQETTQNINLQQDHSEIKQREINNENPAMKILNFSIFAKTVLEELNFARTSPQSYSKKIEKIVKENFDEYDPYTIYINNYAAQLKEGRNAFLDAIQFMRKQKPLNPLRTVEGIKKSAEDLVSIVILHDGNTDDQFFNNKLDDIKTRMNKYGAAVGDLNEIIDYGTFDPEFVVLSFIVCDGDSYRPEREAIFNSKSKYVGISSCLTPSDKICSVLNFAEFFYQKGDLIPSYVVDKYDIEKKYIGKVEKNNHPQRNESFPDYVITTGNNNNNFAKDETKDYADNSNSVDVFSNLGSKMGTFNQKENTYTYNSPPPRNTQENDSQNYMNIQNQSFANNDNILHTPHNHRDSNGQGEYNQQQGFVYTKPLKNSNMSFASPLSAHSPRNNLNNSDDGKKINLIEPIANLTSQRSPRSKYQMLSQFNLKPSANGSRSPENNKYNYIKNNKHEQPKKSVVDNEEKYKINMIKPIQSLKADQSKRSKYSPFVNLKIEETKNYRNNKSKPKNEIREEPAEQGNFVLKSNIPPITTPLPLKNINNIYNSNYFLISSAKGQGANVESNEDFSSNRLILSPNEEKKINNYNHQRKSPVKDILIGKYNHVEKDYTQFAIDMDANNLETLPELVESIHMVERPLKRENINEIDSIYANHLDDVKKTVKKVIHFKDGSSEVILYQK